MPAVTKVPLGGATLNRKWYLDVNIGAFGAPTWVGVFGISDFKDSFTPDLVEDGDFDSAGARSKVVTATDWSLTFTVERKVTAALATVYDPGQEVLRAASYLMGINNAVDVRWYEMNDGGPKVEAWRGYAVVGWDPVGGDMAAKSAVAVTLSARGARTAITHPDGAAAAPVVYSITPNTVAAAGGTLVTVRGRGFFLAGVDNVVATTGVQLVAHNFTSWITQSDNVIVGITPAEQAGASYIKVTNATGPSNVDIVVTSA